MDLVDKEVGQKKIQFADCPFRRFFVRESKQTVPSDAEKISTKYITSSDVSSCQEEVASTSGIYSEVLGEEFVGNNGSLLSLQPWIFKRAKCSRRAEESSDSSSRWSFDWTGFSFTSHGSPIRINSSNSIGSKKRRQYGYNFRPVTFTEKFFLPHHCSENVEIEEYTFNFHPSSIKDESLSFLPRQINSRSREANRKRVDSSVEWPIHDNGFSYLPSSKKYPIDQIGRPVFGNLRTVIGVPNLPIKSLRKTERKCREAMSGSLAASISQKMCKISDPIDSLDGMFLFLIGIAIGVTSNIVSHRMEVEKLNKLLKDNKNLVEDLHEELEMRDTLTLKELANGTVGNKELEHNLNESINTLQNQISSCYATALKVDDCDNLCFTNVGKNLSEIEAELEAELEKLELNINASYIGQRTSDVSELDSELIADVASGELREDLLVKCVTDDDQNTTTSSTTQPYNANYSVSPKELSLRLHKVIESRLEERIKELETALEETQMKLKLVEAGRLNSTNPPFSSSETGSSNLISPKSSKRKNLNLRSNLSGDALVSYDEAYDEFTRLTDNEDDNLPCSSSSGEKKFPEDNVKEQACEQILWRTASYDISATDDDGGGDGDDGDNSFDEGRDLIQKFLEKTRKGSPALINAQKMLFMMDL